MISHLLTVEAQLIRRTHEGATNKYGSATWTDAAPVDLMIHLEPQQGVRFESESSDRPEARAQYKAWLEPDVEISTRDKIVLASSQTFEVFGAPRPQIRALFGTVSHIEVDLVEYQ